MPPRIRVGLLGTLGLLLAGIAWWTLQGSTEPQQALPGKTAGTEEAPAGPAPRRGRARVLPTRQSPEEPLIPSDHGSQLPPLHPLEFAHVTCRLSTPVPASTGALYKRDRTDRLHLVGEAMAVGQEVRFPATRRVGSLVLHLEGYEPIPVRWHSSGEELLCASEPLVLESRAEMTLTGRVLNTAGNPEPDAWVQGCGPAQVDENGVFSVLPVRAPCALRAIRQDGFWYSRSEVTDIPWIEGGSLEVELVVNEYPRGGMGISIEPAEEGIGVLEVHAGSPAAIAGLQAGEIIVSLEGEPSLDLTLEQFVDRATGEAGTDVHFVVKGTDGSEREVTLTRAMLGP